jgi:diadenosine tetraphosphatase ApaH/serine/threonine PP2A family protein phosphatase
MNETIFTFAGKAGDAIMQWPIAYHWARQHDSKFTVWLDEKSCKLVAPLFAAQPCVEKVEFKEGIKSYQCGGQPWHFDLPTSEIVGKTIYHLGFRCFPERQLTLETQTRCNVPAEVDIETLANTNPFVVPAAAEKVNRLVLHGQGVCPHSRTTPGFWKFLASVRHELSERFDELVFVGSPADLEVARLAYPTWALFDDGGDFLKLAEFMVDSRAVIGCGSSPVALAGALKVPCIRVHDPIGEAPRRIWDALGDNQLNDTELGLRTSWPEWRDKWLTASATS